MFRSGMVGTVPAGQGVTRQGRHVQVRRGWVRCVKARHGRQGEVSCDMAWLGPIWHGKARQAEFCRVRSGLATFGPLWLGRRG